jgi:hypothetical protein
MRYNRKIETATDLLTNKIEDMMEVLEKYDDTHCGVHFIKADDGDDFFRIVVTIHVVDIFSEEIKMIGISAGTLLEFADRLVKRAIEARKTINDAFTKICEDVKSLVPKADSEYMPPISIGTGGCSYQSLGRSRYAYVRFDSPSFRASWTKVFFTDELILYDKTMEYMKCRLNAKSAPRTYSSKPPSVLPIKKVHIPYINQAIRESTNLLSRLKSLPLNTSDLKEDIMWEKIKIGKKMRGKNNQEGDCVIRCRANEIADPKKIAAFISESNSIANGSMVMVDDELWIANRKNGGYDTHSKFIEQYILKRRIECLYATSIMNSLLTKFFNGNDANEDDD